MDEPKRCPLFVIRKFYSEEDDEYVRMQEVCQGEILLETEDISVLNSDGTATTACGPTWRLVCENGHVLLLPDHEGDESHELIPWEPKFVLLYDSE